MPLAIPPAVTMRPESTTRARLILALGAIFAAKRSEFSLLGVVAYAATATAIGLLIVAIEIAAFH